MNHNGVCGFQDLLARVGSRLKEFAAVGAALSPTVLPARGELLFSIGAVDGHDNERG